MKPPTARDYLLSKVKGLNMSSTFITNKMPTAKAILIEFAKLHVDAALLEAAKQAKLLVESNWGRYENRRHQQDQDSTPIFKEEEKIEKNNFGHGDCTYEVITPSTHSILSAYPESNIV